MAGLLESWRWEGRLTALLLLAWAVGLGYFRPRLMWAAAGLLMASVLAARWVGSMLGIAPSPAFSPWTLLMALAPLLAGAWVGTSLRGSRRERGKV